MSSPPTLTGTRLRVRPGAATDVAALHAVRSEESVVAWWNAPEPPETLAAQLRGELTETVLVVEVAGAVAGSIQYSEETEPDYRHASIDLYLGSRFQGQGLGAEAVALVATHLIDALGHHRLTIDPAAANERAIRCYARVGFRPVGLMRRYERGPDGTWHDGLLMDLLAAELLRLGG